MKKNCSKCDYVITGRPIWVQKRWPGSVTGVACYKLSRVWGARGHGFKIRGSGALFEDVSIGLDRLEHQVQLGLNFGNSATIGNDWPSH